MENPLQQFGIRKIFFSSHHPQANVKLEFSHRFIKDCVWKLSVNGVLEWDQLCLYATALFNWFPYEHYQESPHFLYFGCDLYLSHLTVFLQPI